MELQIRPACSQVGSCRSRSPAEPHLSVNPRLASGSGRSSDAGSFPVSLQENQHFLVGTNGQRSHRLRLYWEDDWLSWDGEAGGGRWDDSPVGHMTRSAEVGHVTWIRRIRSGF